MKVCFHLWFISGGTKSKWRLRFWINHEFHSSIATLTRPNRMQQKQVILGPFVICLDLKEVLQVGMYQMCACPLLCCVFFWCVCRLKHIWKPLLPTYLRIIYSNISPSSIDILSIDTIIYRYTCMMFVDAQMFRHVDELSTNSNRIPPWLSGPHPKCRTDAASIVPMVADLFLGAQRRCAASRL